MLILVVTTEEVKGVGLQVVTIRPSEVNSAREGDAPAGLDVLEEGWLFNNLEALELHHTTSGLVVGIEHGCSVGVNKIIHGLLHCANKGRGCALFVLVEEFELDNLIEVRVANLLCLELHWFVDGMRGLSLRDLGLGNRDRVLLATGVINLVDDDVGHDGADTEARCVHGKVVSSDLKLHLVVGFLKRDDLHNDLAALFLGSRLVKISSECALLC